MLRLSLLVILLTHSIRTAHVADSSIYKRIYQKLERLNPTNDKTVTFPTKNKLYQKLVRFNSVAPVHMELSEEDEEMLSAMHSWLTEDQIGGVMKELQRMKADKLETDPEYADSDWNDEDPELPESEYPMDANDDWDTEDLPDLSSTSKPVAENIAPLAITKDPLTAEVSAAIAATNARPRIIDDPNMTALERRQLRTAVLISTSALLRAGKCLEPQARWLNVRQLAPAADTVYTPPCVKLHRCAPDSGCCLNEGHVCAPIAGKNIVLPFYLHKADNSMSVVKMEFYNHTQCGCVSRETLHHTITSWLSTGLGKGLSPGLAVGNHSFRDSQEDERPSQRQNDWRMPTEEPSLDTDDEEATAPPQLRRCTCPAQFLANVNVTTPCSCICDWPDIGRRRDCQSLARGKEHFGLRDRVCVARGDCTAPTCEFGPYNKSTGKCPIRRFRRVKYQARARS